MRFRTLSAAGLAAVIMCITVPSRPLAGSVEKIKDGTREAVSEVKKESIQVGKAAAETGRDMKEEAVHTGTAVKEGVKEVGRDIKKAYRETKAAITREFSGKTHE